MAQRSITSFFKVVDNNTIKNENVTAVVTPMMDVENDSTAPNNNHKNDVKISTGVERKIPPKRKILDDEEDSADDDGGETPTNSNDVKKTKEDKVEKIVPSKTATAAINDLNPTDYDPTKSNYHPVKDACWKAGEATPFLALARTFELIEETRGRLLMIDILSNYFSSVILLSPNDLLPSIYITTNQIAPAYEGVEVGVAETYLMKAICGATGRKMDFIKSQVITIGDLGIVAEQSRVAQRLIFKPKPLTVQTAFSKIKDVALTSGRGKIDVIQDMLVACRFSEARYFIRSLIGKLRIGIAEQSLLDALATALVKISTKTESKIFKPIKNIPAADTKARIGEVGLILKNVYCQCPNYDKIIPTLLEYGIGELRQRCPMSPGLPVKPMLANPTKSIHEIFKRFENLKITCEWKYDGERAQIHSDSDGNITIFSRNQENNTTKFPDVIARIDMFRKDATKSFILDSEIVAWDSQQKQILPFQILSTRKRKNVKEDEIKVEVCVYAFDLIYFDGKSMVTAPFIERRRCLHENFNEVDGLWKFATASDTNDFDEVEKFLDDSVKGNCEGLMIKTLEIDATYEIAKRSHSWLKLKKDYIATVGDSLDLIVIGGYRGKGKRTGAYGCFLLACYDDENEEYQSICKIGTGFSDEDLQTHSNFFKNHLANTQKSYYNVSKALIPDDWFEPVQVWEVKCADFSLSPVHKAAFGIVDPQKGISLRFPRFIRIRDDKKPEDGTTGLQIANLYSSQDLIKNNQQNSAASSKNVEEDFY